MDRDSFATCWTFEGTAVITAPWLTETPDSVLPNRGSHYL
jgi:hypothetical protein